MTNKKCSGKRCPLDSTAYNEDCTAVDHCKWFTPKIVTNRQWLESLSDEELAKFMMRADRCNYCVSDDGKCFTYDQPCYKGKCKCMWLQAEHKENEQ